MGEGEGRMSYKRDIGCAIKAACTSDQGPSAVTRLTHERTLSRDVSLTRESERSTSRKCEGLRTRRRFRL